MLNVQGVGKRYGQARALDSVSFEVKPGRVLAVIGANGAGKTTLIKCIVGLLRFEGTIEIGGIDVLKHGKQARAKIGYLSQNPALHPDLTVKETAAFYADLRRVPLVRAREAVEAAGLSDHENKPAGALSGGMKQRLALAMTLMSEPELVILDEPAAGLDISARLDLRRLVQEQRASGRAVVLSTHWLEDVPHVADEALVLDRGVRVYYGAASQFAGDGGPGSRLYLRVNGHASEAIPLLRSVLPREINRTGDWLSVTCHAREKARIVEALARAGIDILDMRIEEADVDAALLRLQAEREKETAR